ncbi:2OG-Fe(II) oxygenase [Pseudomonas sp. NPDC090755]|uniref:2OG-Fe(II) oxygenase n=1 Tax=Pseudomonas sp. NPDC090755 TaxID=3364481 RepID=UPI003839E961
MGQQHSVTSELRHWILRQRAAHYPPQLLYTQLLAAGWSKDVAKQALTEGDPFAQLVTSAPEKPMPEPDLRGSPLYIDVGDRHVQVVQALEHPRLVMFDGLLSADECTALISAARSRLQRSQVLDGDTGENILDAMRSSDGMFFERGENELIARLEQRIALLLRWPLVSGEGLQVLRYAPGAEYAPHYDYFDPQHEGNRQALSQGGQRVATLLMYLQAPERGGATVFPDIGLELMPRCGSAVFFSYDEAHPSTRTLHGGSPVLAGEKWVATKWLREYALV